MMSRKAAYSWFAAMCVLSVFGVRSSAGAQTPYFEDTTLTFEADCNAAAINDAEFAGGTADRLDLSATRFLACGIESINSPGDGGIGFTAPQLHRPGLGNLAIDPISGVANGTALVGGSDITTLRDLIITFVTPVNELRFRVLDVDVAARLTIELRAANNSVSTLPFTLSSGVATIDEQFPNGVKAVTLKYDEQGGIDNWGVDDLQFNSWDCGDGETETDHVLDGGRKEVCDDGDTINCDGTCGNDCQLSIIDGCCTAATLAGCLDDTNCVADNTKKPGSGGCAACDLTLRTGAVDVGFDALESNTASCNDGLNCTLTDTCDGAGKCIGTAKTCAADSLSCTTDACSETAGGACVQTVTKGCVIGDSCVGAGVINDDNRCEVCDPSKSETDWTTRTSGTCGDPSCMDGELTPAATCNASGTCMQPPKVSCDGAVCADAISCTGECQTDEDCQSENHCEAGKCVPDGKPGDPCTRAGECSTNFCVDGVCCDGECEGACKACNIAGSVGMCTAHEVGTDPENKCPDPQVCGPDGSCEPAPNGSECDKNEVCGSGHCADGFCCDQVCNGACEACNIMGAFGTCTFQTVGTDPENECGGGDAVCSGAGECVSYETRGNGLCTVDFARRSAPWLVSLLGLIGLVFASRRRRGA